MTILHVIVAVSSIILASIAFVAVAKWALFATYFSAILTLLSGVYLVVTMPASMIHFCVSGVIYLAIVSVGITFARRRIKAHGAVYR